MLLNLFDQGSPDDYTTVVCDGVNEHISRRGKKELPILTQTGKKLAENWYGDVRIGIEPIISADRCRGQRKKHLHWDALDADIPRTQVVRQTVTLF